MAGRRHLTNAELQTLMAKTVINIKPFEVNQLIDALSRVKYTQGTDADAGSTESTLGTIFPVSGLNP